jgi:4-amino-4-deoxy-L-arabinose transferase-like glycosyltransferase
MVLKQKTPLINKIEILSLLIILVIGCIFRFWGLGYSHFYGDETKTLYLDKTVPAASFLLDQRKGPVQFLVSWVVEKITGGYSELYIRIPFAIAGWLSILAFYLTVRKLFGWKASVISTFLFSLNGFNIAFSRTAQYQSFLILFGFLSIYFFIFALETRKARWYLLSSLAFTASLYSHYDAVFFLIPIVYMFFVQEKKEFRKAMLFFLVPSFVLLSFFYIPYVFKGFLYSNTISYVGRRLSGSDYTSNNSFYTFLVYNPLGIHFIFITLSLLYILFFRTKDKIRELFLYWFLIVFMFFNGVISSPGTHIHNFFIPLYIISGPSVLWVFSRIHKKLLKTLCFCFFGFFCASLIIINGYVYIPTLNSGYPWKPAQLGMLTLKPANKGSYHLFLYGFPYNRGWDQIRDYLYSKDGVRGFYTNDSSVLSKYYLKKFDYTPTGSNFLPQYYIDIVDNMEFVKTDVKFLENYVKEKEITKDGQLLAIIYKLTPLQVVREG